MQLLRALAVVVLFASASCEDRKTVHESAATPTARELDLRARETGALPDRERVDPAGIYQRRYEGGGDRLCLVPEGTGGKRFTFGAETRFGGEEYCLGRGKARLAGDKLLLTFEGGGSSCVIVAGYEGDRIVMPGSVDVSCAALCSGRGSFSGASFPRVRQEKGREQPLKGGDGQPLCR